jgi:tripartite-type tricarboxylate transporter receptor subunit TctC
MIWSKSPPMTRRQGALRLGAAAIAMAAIGLNLAAAFAQDYPNRPITAVVPFGAGGGADTQTRIWGEAMAGLTGQRIVVENVAGSAGVAGTKQGISAEPDGYTVVMGAASTIAINPVSNPAADYYPPRDLRPVAVIGYTPYVMVVANDLGIKSLPELIEFGKANEDALTYAGWTAVGEFARRGLELRTGLAMTPVPYPGATEAMTDVIAGRASAAILDISSALPFIRSGSVTPIVMTGPDKSSALPDVGTVVEAGIENYVIDSWIALFVPRETPDEIVQFLNAKTREALKSSAATARYAELEIELRDYDVSETEAFMARQVDAWAALIHEAGPPQ